MLKYNFGIIAVIIELEELSGITVLSPQEFVNLQTWYAHYDCVQNDQLPRDWFEYYNWMQRFQRE